jgi:hypothetical protein
MRREGSKMKHLAATLAALGAMAVVVMAEGAGTERRMARPESTRSSVERLMAADPGVHTQEPVQSARCTEKHCTSEPIEVEVMRGSSEWPLPDSLATATWADAGLGPAGVARVGGRLLIG